MMEHFPAKVIVNTKAIEKNTALVFEKVKKHISSDCQVMAIVKANAYGHGLIESAKAALSGGANFLGVAKVAEALLLRNELRKEGLNPRIFCWIYGPDAPWDEMVEAKLDFSITTAWEVEKLANAVRKAKNCGKLETNEKLQVHLKVDTGMSRNGFTKMSDEFEKAVSLLLENKDHLEVAAVWSHLAWADSAEKEAREFTLKQLESFEKWVDEILELGLSPKFAHIFASSAILREELLGYKFRNGLKQIVRPGLLLYGISPAEDFVSQSQLEKDGFEVAMEIQVPLNNVKKISAGSGISYSQKYHVKNDTWIGVVPVGYSDGIFRSAGGEDNKPGAPTLVKKDKENLDDKIARIAGVVCMDQFLIDLGESTNAKAGDFVTLFGSGNSPRVNEWAKICSTIPYEILTSISEHAERVVL